MAWRKYLLVYKVSTIIDFFVPEFVNRESQISAFKKVLGGQLKRSAFLIRGEAEIGKSFLLLQIWHMARHELISRLDFRDGEAHTFLSMIQCAIEDFGREAFSTTLGAIQRITHEARHDITFRSESIHHTENLTGEVNIAAEDVNIRGDVVGRDLYRTNIFLPPTENSLQRQALEQQISSIFFDDLRAFSQPRRIILSYDSFESASKECQQWLAGILLDEIARGRLPGVIVVVAGRTIPEVGNMLMPYSIVTELGTFDSQVAMEYWIKRRELNGELFQNIYADTGGHPKRLADKANAAGGKPLQHQIFVI